MKQKGIESLRLVREPENPYDSNAIAIHADYGLGDCVLGYVQNKARICLKGHEMSGSKVDVVCPICGSELVRNGLATELARWMDAGNEFKAKVLNISDGDGGNKNIGCNIRISRVR
jgi:hypothetical protein